MIEPMMFPSHRFDASDRRQVVCDSIDMILQLRIC